MSRPENRAEFWDALVPLTLQDGSAFTLENVRRALGMTDAECARAEELLNDGVANPRYDDISAREFVSDMLQSWFGAIMDQIHRERVNSDSPERLAALQRLSGLHTRDYQDHHHQNRADMVALARIHITLLRQYRDLKFKE